LSSLFLHRPPGHNGKKEHYIISVAKDLEHAMTRAYGSLSCDTLRLTGSSLEELSRVLVEFAEDLHNDIGIWKGFEKYNIEFFGTPLPLVLSPDENIGSENINVLRIQFLLWRLYSELTPELLMSPKHNDLKNLSTVVADFLEKRFKDIPRGSSVKEFLSGPDNFCWEVKRKLVWLGTHSYLFRNSCRNYIENNGGKPEIPIIDDFICQQATAWSGLGVIDILAVVLDIPEEQGLELRSWYERHLAVYQIMTSNDQHADVKNLISGQMYAVQVAKDTPQIKIGAIVIGSLIPWKGEWAWSGQQSVMEGVKADTIQEFKDQFLRKCPEIVYRYYDGQIQKARDYLARQYQEYTMNYGNDLVIFPDGISMAADRQKEIRRQWEHQPREVIAKAMAEYDLKGPAANINFPPDILKNKNGVGVFYNPEEGEEIVIDFNDIVSGFKKKGIDLNQNEQDAIRSFISSDNVSPDYVKRLIQEYGSESIQTAFFIPAKYHDSHLDFLLRCYKGAYYRKRYPRIALI
jgi:hypothetical protein